MKRLGQKVCLVAVLSLAFVAIWHDSVLAAGPTLQSLGQITEGVNTPARMDIDGAGTLYVSDVGRNAVTRYNQYGKALPVLRGNYRVKPGIAVAPDGSRVFIAVNDPGKPVTASPTAVAVVDGKTGALISYLRKSADSDGLNEFKYVTEIDLDAAGNVYVADSEAKKVSFFSGNTYLWTADTSGAFKQIDGMSVNAQTGEVYVMEAWGTFSGIAQVWVLDKNSTTFRLITTNTTFEKWVAGTQYNSKPHAMAFDQFNRAYMLSSAYGSIHFFMTPITPPVPMTTGWTPYLGNYTNPPLSVVDPPPLTLGMTSALPNFDIAYDVLTSRLYVATDPLGIQIYGVDGAANPVRAANASPSIPEQISPTGLVSTLSPELVWKASTDADEGDVLTYNVELVDADGQLLETFTAISGTSFQIPAGKLAENKQYGWRVQAQDDSGLSNAASAASIGEKFWVNALQEAPSTVALIAPAADDAVEETAMYSWQAAVDVDPGSSLSYRLEIAAGSDFVAPLISVALDGTGSAPLSTLEGFSGLQAGNTYSWRVLAVDNTGLASASELRNFVYTSASLTVDASMPGAKVYVGGNHAYPGRLVGTAPVEVRGLRPGTHDIVVQRAGFEPWVSAVTVAQGGSATIKAQLVPAIAPDGLKLRPLSAAGQKIQLGMDSVPFAVDFGSDGVVDLLVADNSGQLILYKGITGAPLNYAAGQALPLSLAVGATPIVADWNNDSLKDLLVGTASGTVQLYINIGTQAQPNFGSSVELNADSVTLDVGNAATPAVVDLNADGAKDLLVGNGDGKIRVFFNIGTDSSPLLDAGTDLIAIDSATTVSPYVTDWDADGADDILVASSQGVAVYTRQSATAYAKKADILIAEETIGSANTMVAPLHIFAYDADGMNGKDLIVGNAAGQIRLAASFGKAVVPGFDKALQAKVEQFAALLNADSALNDLVAQLEVQLVAGNYNQAKKQIRLLQLAQEVLDNRILADCLAELAAQIKVVK